MALGGFSAAQADELRRAMGHIRKLPKLHAALERLRLACIAHGVGPAVAQQVVDDLHSFANYGFPESHAWSFALIAYATASLKANYPAEFFLGMLNAWPMGFYPPATLVHDARRHGVTVLGPCLRDGEWECTIVAPRETDHRSHTKPQRAQSHNELQQDIVFTQRHGGAQRHGEQQQRTVFVSTDTTGLAPVISESVVNKNKSVVVPFVPCAPSRLRVKTMPLFLRG
jgi:DNA polymerase III alpha subunit